MSSNQHASMPRPGARSLGDAVLSTSAGDLLGRGAVLLTTLLAARAFAPSEFASFVGLSAVVVFAAGLWDFGFSALATREVAAGRSHIRTTLAVAMRTRLQMCLLWAAAFAAGSLVLNAASPASIPLVALGGFAICSIFAATSVLLLALLRASLEFRGAALALASGRWLTTLLTAGAFALFGSEHGLVTIAATVAAGEALTLSVAAYLVWRRSSFEQSEGTVATNLGLRAAMPFAANGLLAIAYNRLDIIVVAALTTTASVAAYAPASRIQDVLYLVPSVAGVVTFPLIARAWAGPDGPKQTIQLVSRFILLGLAVAVPIAVLGTIFAPEAIRLVLGPDYMNAVTPTRIIIWFLPLAVIQAPLLAALGASGHAGDTTRIFASTFAVAIVMHLLLDPKGGASGAAVASLSRDIVAVPITIVFAVRAGLLALPGAMGPRLQGVVRGARW